MNSGNEKGWNILLVEDNPADVRLTREVLRGSSRPLTLHVARDGEQALAMLPTATSRPVTSCTRTATCRSR